MSRKLIGGIAAALAAVVLIAVGVVFLTKNKSAAPAKPSAIATATPDAPSTAPVNVPAELQGCLLPAKTIIPAKLEIPSMKLSTDVMSLGSDKDGKPIDPPHERLLSWGWTNDGPRIGDSKGWAIMTAHTHSENQQAPGNRLADKTGGIKKGDIIRISDAQGQTVCYRFAEAKKIWVDKFSAEANEVYSNDGAPKIVVQTCADYDPTKQGAAAWRSRLIYYADLVAKV